MQPDVFSSYWVLGLSMGNESFPFHSGYNLGSCRNLPGDLNRKGDPNLRKNPRGLGPEFGQILVPKKTLGGFFGGGEVLPREPLFLAGKLTFSLRGVKNFSRCIGGEAPFETLLNRPPPNRICPPPDLLGRSPLQEATSQRTHTCPLEVFFSIHATSLKPQLTQPAQTRAPTQSDQNDPRPATDHHSTRPTS